jgi:hypothetical protein
MELQIILAIIWLHFIADFLLQTDYMALNKCKSISALSFHCIVYSIPFLAFGPEYALLAGMFHFPVDFVTSKITAKLYEQQRIGLFFKVIGLDQAIHMTVLVLTFEYFFS